MSTPPPLDAQFVLSRPNGTVQATGVRQRFTDATVAADALRVGLIDAVVGAVGFDVDDPCALIAPATLHRSPHPVSARSATPRRITAFAEVPTASEHADRVQEAVEAIRRDAVRKVVLARALELSVEPVVDVDELVGALAGGNTQHNAFATNLDVIDPGAWLVGSSPELLLRKDGREVFCHPYAGTAPRCADPDADAAAARTLASSAKDHHEHAFVVDYLRRRLAPLSDIYEAPDQPQLTSTGEVWHLATPIRAVLTSPDLTALDLALMLTPTPAVGGTPSEIAAQYIRDHEEPRGFYSGTLGWADADGNGEWMVSIRCLRLAADRHSLRAWGGGGIVANSDPAAELDETTAKLRTVLRAVGVSDSEFDAAAAAQASA